PWALMTTGYPASSALATASSTVTATPPGDTGIPKRAKYRLPWYSRRSTSVRASSLGGCPLLQPVERLPEPCRDRRQGGARCEHLGHAELLELGDVGVGNDSPAHHQYV